MIWPRHPAAALCLAAMVACTGGGEPSDAPSAVDAHAAQREALVRALRADPLIDDAAVLDAMRRVERHLFVPEDVRHLAYRNQALPIGRGQTISQPLIVAFMTQALRLERSDKVLEIGTGSAYQAAVLAELVDRVYSIEIVEALGVAAGERLVALGYDNVEVRIGDGYRGWPEQAPFDAIIVTAAPGHVPEPLVEQLRVGGRMVLPVGDRFQQLMLLEKREGGVVQRRLLDVRFVPMTGEAEKK